MKYVCVECGDILNDADTIINPDGDANCAECYENKKTEWFVEEDESETKPEETTPEPSTTEEKTVEQKLEQGSEPKKKHIWDRK